MAQRIEQNCNIVGYESFFATSKNEYNKALREGSFTDFNDVFFKAWAIAQENNLIEQYFVTENNRQTICSMINSIYQAEKKTTNRISLLLLGPKSVGKTFLFKSLLAISKFLSSSLVSVHYSIPDAETNEMDTPYSLLKKEYLSTQSEPTNMILHGKEVSCMEELIQYLHSKGKIPFIIVDEIDLLYKMDREICRRTVAQLHKIGDTKGCLGWITGNRFVTKSVVFQQIDEIPQEYHKTMPSLNSTKYTTYWLTGIDNKPEWKEFLQSQIKTVTYDDVQLEQIYKATGGLFGKLGSFINGNTQNILHHSYWKSLHWEVIYCLLTYFQDATSVWEMKRIPKQMLIRTLQEKGYLKHLSELNEVVDSGLLIEFGNEFKIGNFEMYDYALKEYTPL